jgi:hypothetical protein
MTGLPSPHRFGKAGWTGRVRPAPGPRELESLRDAAQDIAEQAGRAPSLGRNAFQNVYNVALLATVVLSGTLAGVHLWRNLFARHKEHGHESTPAHEHNHAR